MNRLRGLLAAVGVVGVAVGLATFAAPGIADAVPVQAVVEVLGGPWVLAALFGAAALVVVLAVILMRGVGGIDQATPPAPEDVYEVPHPGNTFDEFLDGLDVGQRLSGERHRDVRERLRKAACATLMRVEDLDKEEAVRRVDDGAWTDDDVAASFLATRETPGLGGRLVATLRGETRYRRGARRAALAVAAYDGGGRR